MVTKVDHLDKAPAQPMGWRVNAYVNATTQARQETERQRARVVQLERRNRRMRAAVANALALMTTFGFAMLALGVLLGYAFGVGLLGLVR